jgi:hypothetical protein
MRGARRKFLYREWLLAVQRKGLTDSFRVFKRAFKRVMGGGVA